MKELNKCDGIASNILGMKNLDKIWRNLLGENREIRSKKLIVWQNPIWWNVPLLTDSVVHQTDIATHLLPNPSMIIFYETMLTFAIFATNHIVYAFRYFAKDHIGILTTLQLN